MARRVVMSRGGTHAKQQLVFDRIMKKKKKKKNEISYSNVQGERERESINMRAKKAIIVGRTWPHVRTVKQA